jgi:hypothetical protein
MATMKRSDATTLPSRAFLGFQAVSPATVGLAVGVVAPLVCGAGQVHNGRSR